MKLPGIFFFPKYILEVSLLLQQQGVIWVDVESALKLVDSRAELEEAVSDPEAFFKKLLRSGGPAARRMLIAQCQPYVESSLQKKGLQCSDVQPMLESIGSQNELQQAMKDLILVRHPVHALMTKE